MEIKPKLCNMREMYYKLAPDLSICRILNGMWQVAGGHGHIDQKMAIADMMKYYDAGFTTWDLADIYGPAEDFIGEFRQTLLNLKGQEDLKNIQSLTKWVPQPGKITSSIVNESIKKSLHRMQVSSLDMLQFHWWDYNNQNYMDALNYLSNLREKGLIKHLGLTNFDTKRIQYMIDSNLKIISNQVQYSIIDRRPEVKMAQFCLDNKVHLLAYGTICGGFISERYVGRREPSSAELNTLSLRKYKRMIDIWGGWALFQDLLLVLKKIAEKHNVSIANIAINYILGKSAVAGVIVGVRLGIVDHIDDNKRSFSFNLDSSDNDAIDAVCTKSNNLFGIIGDCGDEYR